MKKIITALLLTTTLGISGCNLTTDGPSSARTAGENGLSSNVFTKGFNPFYRGSNTNERLQSAAKQAVEDGNPAEALNFYKELYQKDSSKPENALNYAQVLRKTGNAQRASMVLAPFVKEIEGRKTSSKKYNPMILLEQAAAELEIGRYEQSEKTLVNMLNTPEASDLYPQIRNLIGVSLNARGQHKAAEGYYRDAMDTWDGQPITVMNNLALSLAHQGYFDEALSLLRQARVMDPSETMVAANINLITDLQNAVIAKPKSLN